MPRLPRIGARRALSAPCSVAALALLLHGSGCAQSPSEPSNDDPPAAEIDDPSAALVKKLRSWEYRNTIASLLGDAITIDAPLPPDLVRANFSSVSAALDCYGDVDVEAFEQAALDVAAQAFAAQPDPLEAAGCQPTDAADACVGQWLSDFGRSAWRRPLSAEEQVKFQQLAVTLATSFEGDVYKATELTMAALLQSPHFLYRVELGEPLADDPETRKYTPHEMATRLAYTLWETTPDEYLLDAAAAGELATEESVREFASAMLTHPRAEVPLQRFWREHLAIDRLTLSNHPSPEASASLYADMRLEGQYLAARLTDPGTDALELLTLNEAWLTPALAEHYGVTPPTEPGWVSLPPQRRGFLTSGVFLASSSHPGKTSPTRRGKFVVERVLCARIPPPPADVDLSLPDVAPGEATRREQMELHSSAPACSGCHQVLDPPGFAFEGFDELGRARTLDNDLPVDTRGVFRGQAFDGATQLIEQLHDSPDVPRCIVRQAFRHTLGQVDTPAQEPYIDALTEGFVASGHDYRALVVDIVSSRAFRYARGTEAPEPTGP